MSAPNSRRTWLDELLVRGVSPLMATILGGVLVWLIALPFLVAGTDVDTAPKALALVVPVLLASVFGGRIAAFVVAVTAAVAFGYLVPPYGSVRVALGPDLFALGVFLLIATLVTTLVARRVELLDETDRQRRALLRSVSHDLRTPLAVIRAASTELLADADHNEAARARMLQLIAGETERLDRLVANLLDLSRIEAGPLQPQLQSVDLGDVIDDCATRLLVSFPDVMVARSIAPDAGHLEADPVLLGQLFTNLLENAARHGSGQTVWIDAMLDGSTVCITVRDDGPGVPPKLATRIFEPFEAGDGSAGRGIGLAICRAIANAHGGNIRLADSEPGATFEVRLPAG